jgi:hypothetical protein
MRERKVEPGTSRGPKDGCRRYRPIHVTFDTRNIVLDMDIKPEWEPQIKDMWAANQEGIRANLLADLGWRDGIEKLDNYRAMGVAPWSVVFEHSVLLQQVRNSFAHGDFYPALVGACALGERLLNELILALRDDFKNHSATTRRVRGGRVGAEWGALISVLHGWGVFDDEVAETYRQLEELRHAAVHFVQELPVKTREPALDALLRLQTVVERVFEPHGGPPRFIAETPGDSYISLEAEDDPLIRRVFLPRSVLVSPVHRLEWDESADRWSAFDDLDFEPSELTDDQFAAALNAIGAERTERIID